MNPIEAMILCLAGFTLVSPTSCLVTIPIIGVGVFILTYIQE